MQWPPSSGKNSVPHSTQRNGTVTPRLTMRCSGTLNQARELQIQRHLEPTNYPRDAQPCYGATVLLRNTATVAITWRAQTACGWLECLAFMAYAGAIYSAYCAGKSGSSQSTPCYPG